MKTIIIAFVTACFAVLALGAPAHAERDNDRKTLLQILFPPSPGYMKGKHRSDKSPIPRRVVRMKEKYPAGTIVIDTSERRLYHVMANGKAMKYGVGVGREGFTWNGKNKVSRKAEWPGWTPPEVMRRRDAACGQANIIKWSPQGVFGALLPGIIVGFSANAALRHRRQNFTWRRQSFRINMIVRIP